MKKPRCLLIYSGGLDSTLAVKYLESIGVDVVAINFVSYFFGAGQAKKTAEANNINLLIFDNEEFKKKHWELVQKPKYGHGKAMNPCVDCHLLMFQTAGKITKGEIKIEGCSTKGGPASGWDFVASGEVLGERPMSQNPRALKEIAKQSGIEGYLLRPLSAKLLEPTIPEKEGLIDREKLLDFHGRGRTRQMALAKQLGVNYYPTPAGGCCLTDEKYGDKLKELINKVSVAKITSTDLALLKIGRHFWSETDNLAMRRPCEYKIILGRDESENDKLEASAGIGDVFIEPENFSGPAGLARFFGESVGDKTAIIEETKNLIIKFSKNAPNKAEFKMKGV